MRIFIYLLFFASVYNGYCQNPTVQWARTFVADTSSFLYPIDAHADRMGRVLISGDLMGTVTLGQSILHGTGNTGCLVSYKADGSLAWTGTFDLANNYGWAIPRHVTHDGLGNGYVAGSLTGTVDINPGQGLLLLSSLATHSILSSEFIIKLNSAGQLQWTAQFPELVTIQKITADSSGNAIVTGYFAKPSDLDPGPGVFTSTLTSGYFVMKLDPAGSFKWAVTASTGGGGVHALSTDGKGRVNIGGYCFGNYKPCNLAPAPAVFNSSIAAGFVVRLDSNGIFTDGTLIPGGINVTSIETDKHDNRLLAGIVGSYYSYNDLDPGPATVPVSTLVTAFVEKLDAGGALLWVRTIEKTPVYLGYQQYYIRLNADRDGRSWVCLDSGGPLLFQSTTHTFSVQPSSPGIFYALAHYDANGSIMWSGKVGTLNTSWSWNQTSQPFAVTANGDIYLSAHITKTCELEPVMGSFTVAPINANCTFLEKISVCTGEHQVSLGAMNNTICKGEVTYLGASGALYYQWEPHLPAVPIVSVSPTVSTLYEVAAIDSAGCMSTASVMVNVDACLRLTELEHSKVRLYPVPAQNSAYLESFEQGLLSIKDLCGRELIFLSIDRGVTEIPLSQLTAGVYLWELKTGTERREGKLIKE